MTCCVELSIAETKVDCVCFFLFLFILYRSELDECHAKTWLRNCEDILKSMSEFVACHSKACHVGCIAFTLTLMDYLIEYVAVVEKVCIFNFTNVVLL